MGSSFSSFPTFFHFDFLKKKSSFGNFYFNRIFFSNSNVHFYLFALVLPFLTLFYNFFMVPPRIEALEGGGGKKRRRQEEGGGRRRRRGAYRSSLWYMATIAPNSHSLNYANYQSITFFHDFIPIMMNPITLASIKADYWPDHQPDAFSYFSLLMQRTKNKKKKNNKETK